MVTGQLIAECDDPEIQELIVSACHSGERIVLKGKDGTSAALVPVEDLEVLEQIEDGRFLSKSRQKEKRSL